ncbi:MAG: non-canonical purine NTP pyrophosphatase, partial [Fibrobacteraceae bacterium]|nr:non-canonical purine NTP pyrophosphatase [Fibrobacteraceae bacterium]
MSSKTLLVIATGNAGKIRDFAGILGNERFDYKTLKDIGFEGDIEENADTFAGNAKIKAKAVADFLHEKKISAWVLADDSGLEVFALGGAPGVYSARYSGVHGNDLSNNELLLKNLENIEDRSARYYCALALLHSDFPEKEVQIFEGECRGRIGYEPVGTLGFGYDPLFIPDGFMGGTSSSAWQIEGIADKKAGQESWAELFYNSAPEKWHNGIGPDVACDFYHRYKEDIKTMASFGLNTFRFTIQWARFMLDPIKGIVSEDAVKYYRDVIKTIKENGMKPIISLEHWDIPAVLIEKYNGWAGRETLDLYEIYVASALKEFASEVDLWFAFTEPNIPIDNGYMDKKWYPFTHDPKT